MKVKYDTEEREKVREGKGGKRMGKKLKIGTK
jgi:hypothetical protein